MENVNSINQIAIALTWCLAWGEKKEPNHKLSVLRQMREALLNGTEVSAEIQSLLGQIQQIENLSFPERLDDLMKITKDFSTIWDKKIGLVYGGATKIKQYVFESANLQEIRGASAILDRINLIDLPGFFGKTEKYIETEEPELYKSTEKWLDKNFPNLKDALIPELIIYSTGGNILAFCPTAFVDDLANAIERRYTEETLTSNSCAVGAKFKLLETRLGLLKDNIGETKWLDWYLKEDVKTNPLVEAYFGKLQRETTNNDNQSYKELFQERKSFNELAGKLATLFNQRRSGNETVNRPSRRYPPIFETHPYLQRDTSDSRSAVAKIEQFPQEAWLSEPSARKLLMGQVTKRIEKKEKLKSIYAKYNFNWNPGKIKGWVERFTNYLQESGEQNRYYQNIEPDAVEQARSLKEIGNASKGFVAFIYADGNNMGGYIQNNLKTPEDYQRFSLDIFSATENSVYEALGEHIHPHKLHGLTGEEAQNRNGKLIHPFEILAIGGDDVLLIVPANKALVIAKTIGEEFEKCLVKEADSPYKLSPNLQSINSHRYIKETAAVDKCLLSMSAGVLITSQNTPVYYAENLTNQLLKSAKKKAKQLKKEYGYFGGTVDLLTLKSVTMISSNIEAFREEALVKKPSGKAKLKLYATPYTLHELGGLIKTVEAFKKSEFPKSQLYQIRSLLEQGKRTAILNYLYFYSRLKKGKAEIKTNFEDAWCEAKTNDGNLAPWMYDQENKLYETIWREIVEIYPFIEKPETDDSEVSNSKTIEEVNL